MIINKDVINSLKPCADRYENYLEHYANFSGNQDDFFELPEISHNDKLWVILRLMPRELVEVFAIDCAVSAYAHADAYVYADAYAHAAAADAAYAHAAAADAAAAAAAAYANAAYDDAAYANAVERTRQLDAISYLISIYEV